MITKEEYSHACFIRRQYLEEQSVLKKIKGKSICPFCNGSKIVPLLSTNMFNQTCRSCDTKGMIENKLLYQMGLIDMIK